MFESWPAAMGQLGAERKKHWWTELWGRGETIGIGEEKVVMEQT